MKGDIVKQILAISMSFLVLGNVEVEAKEITGAAVEYLIVYGEVIRRDVPFTLADSRSREFYDEVHFQDRVYYCTERFGFKSEGAKKVPNKVILVCYDTDD